VDFSAAQARVAAVTEALSLSVAAEAVLTFLESVGRRSEAELYLRLFRQAPMESFAIVATDAPVIRHGLGSLLEHLRFLADLGLVSPVVVGASSPDTSLRGASQLASQLPRVGLGSSLHEMTARGLSQVVRSELLAERVPLLWFVPERSGGARERYAQLGELGRDLKTRKVVVLRQRGSLALRDDLPQEERLGLWGPGGELSVINLRTDRELLLESKLLRHDDARLLDCLDALLEAAADPCSNVCGSLTVSVTSPLNLLRELFTVRGDGTLVKVGAEIRQVRTYGELDCERLQGLLERSFERQLLPEFFQRVPNAVYFEANYRGAAILEPSGVAPYLTKLAVEPIAQGEGIGRDLWRAVARDHPAFFWRARPTNPILGWYLSLCDGVVRLPKWHVYWRGLRPELIPGAVQEALDRGEDFLR
jgi:GNAT superfamily N-acetyltransferase